jgi:hypothetical protein
MINKHTIVYRISHVEPALPAGSRSRNMNFMQSPFDSACLPARQAQDDYLSNLLCMITDSHFVLNKSV